MLPIVNTRAYAVRILMDKKTQTNKVNKKYILQSTQSFIPIQDVKDGIIITKDGRLVKILEFSPINFLLRADYEKNSIIYTFESVLKIAPINVQFKVITKKANTHDFIAAMLEEQEKEENYNCKMLQQDSIEFIASTAIRQGVSRRFFIIFEWEKQNNIAHDLSFSQKAERIEYVASSIIRALRQCDNNLVVANSDPCRLTSEILYSILQRNRSERVPFDTHISQVLENYKKGYNVSDIADIPVEISATDFFAPAWIDFTHPNYIVVDNKYYTFAYIPSNGYCDAAYAGWLATFINMGEGIDIDIFLKKISKSEIINKIGRKIRQNHSRVKDMQDSNTDYDDACAAINSGYYLKDGLQNGEDFYYASILITIARDSEEELELAYTQVKDYLMQSTFEITRCKYRQEQAFMSTLPLCRLDKGIFSSSKRNMLTSGAASMYPFISPELRDNGGILFGINQSNNSLVIVDIFNSHEYTNANMALMGTSGAGKTFTTQCIATRMRRQGIQVFIIAPLKEHEFRRACNAVGGSFITISAGSQTSINIMEIRKVDTSSNQILDGYEAKDEDSRLADKIQTMHVFFRLIYSEMSILEEETLDKALIETYKRKGITMDNSSLIDPTDNSKYREMPILGDLQVVLQEFSDNGSEEARVLATVLNRFVSGSASSFNRQTNVNLDNKYIVIGISKLRGNLLSVGMFVALDYVWDKIKEDRTVKKAVILDELWKLISESGSEIAGEYVLEIFKTIRGYGGSAIAATQDLNDFMKLSNGKFGKGIINNSETKIILKLKHEEAVSVKETLRLTDCEMSRIERFERGETLFCTSKNSVIVSIKASPLEEMLITTDPEQLRAIKKKLQEEGKGIIEDC